MFPKENKISFRNSHVDWTKVTVLWAETWTSEQKWLNLGKDSHVLVHVPVSCLPASRRWEGKEQSGKGNQPWGPSNIWDTEKRDSPNVSGFGSRAFVLSLSFINWSKVTKLLAEALFYELKSTWDKDISCSPTTVYKGSHWRLPNWQGLTQSIGERGNTLELKVPHLAWLL